MTMLRLWCARASTRSRGLIAASFVLTTLLLSLLAPVIHKDAVDVLQRPSFNGKQGQSTAGTHVFPNQSGPPSGREYLDVATGSKLHMLLPATKSNVNLCKTLLTLGILGYPAPHIVSWGKEDDAKDLLGGGSHFAKITGVLEYINDEKRRDQQDFDDELVVMIDSYDIWFQLPVEVLISRYRAIVADDDERVARRMGRAFDREDIHANIVFGAGKRCSPNQIHTLACYPIPESPLPMGLHGGNTDTLMGRNQYSSFRTRYLNSGYMMGPIGAMRPLLERAKVKLDECANRTGASFDNGSGDSDYCYHGSDQSIFVEMHGEQEFHREVMRRHHRSGMDDYLDRVISNRAGSRTPPSHIQNAPIEDFLNPAFTHQAASDTYLPDKPFEFGITLDYWSLLGHQTSNAEYDTRYIRHDAALEPQVGDQGMFDCPAKAQMPDDLPIEAPGLFLEDAQKNSWRSIPLYTEICVGTVPVMIHHNSVDKWWREAQWDKTWWHGRSRGLLEERRKAGLAQLNEGIPTDAALSMSWEELCPRSVEKELFRDVEDPSPVA